jgi:hypothetical protein
VPLRRTVAFGWLFRSISVGGAGPSIRSWHARSGGMRLRCAVLDGFAAQRWFTGIIATARSNLCVVGVLIPLWFSPCARRVGRRVQAESRITGGKCFGRPSL